MFAASLSGSGDPAIDEMLARQRRAMAAERAKMQAANEAGSRAAEAEAQKNAALVARAATAYSSNGSPTPPGSQSGGLFARNSRAAPAQYTHPPSLDLNSMGPQQSAPTGILPDGGAPQGQPANPPQVRGGLFAAQPPALRNAPLLPQAGHHDSGSEPDYGAHYNMHGRGPDGRLAEKKRNTGQKILRVVGDVLLGIAAGQGNPLAIDKLKRRRDSREARQQMEADFAEHSNFVNIMMRQGLTPDEAELASMNPEKFAEEYVSRFRTREVSEGETVFTPDLGGRSPQTWTAPKTVVNENDVYRVDVNPVAGAPMLNSGGVGPGVQPIGSMRSKAAQAALDAGFSPGTDAYRTFLKDYYLDGQGPTAVEMNDARLRQSDRNNVRSTTTSSDNSVRSTTTSRENSVRSSETTQRGQNLGFIESRDHRGGRGKSRGGSGGYPDGTIIAGPNGQKMIRRNGQWVPHN